MWRAIESLAAAGKTVLLTTHYLEEADALANRIIVMNKGRVVCQGTPAEVKARGAATVGDSATGASALPVKIIRCTTTLPVEVLRALEGVIAAEQRAGRTVLSSTSPERTVLALLQQDPDLGNLEVVSPALDDAFLALTAA